MALRQLVYADLKEIKSMLLSVREAVSCHFHASDACVLMEVVGKGVKCMLNIFLTINAVIVYHIFVDY